MPSLRTLLVSSALGALAITALGVPASAADTQGTLAFVNGIPGKKVDVCLNGNEIKSALKYGGKVFRNVVGTGNKNLKFYERDPRTCRGTLLAQDSFPLGPGDDLTIVATKNAPKVVTFDNVFLGEIPPFGGPFAGAFIAWRHAAEPAVNFKYRRWDPNPESPIAPSADPLWIKGDEFLAFVGADSIFQLRATLPESPASIAGPTRVLMGLSHRYEWILVGTNPGNTRFVLLDRAISQDSP